DHAHDLQRADGIADGAAAHAELPRQIALGRQPVSWLEHAAGDELLDLFRDLFVPPVLADGAKLVDRRRSGALLARMCRRACQRSDPPMVLWSDHFRDARNDPPSRRGSQGQTVCRVLSALTAVDVLAADRERLAAVAPGCGACSIP